MSKMRPMAHLSRDIITSVVSRMQSNTNIATNLFRASKAERSGWDIKFVMVILY
ncbi:MAG: hypothetical protein ACMG55_17780 [Microcoleus sp.]